MSPGARGARLRASAPTRVDLAGGTLDIWPLYLLLEGARTVNVAVSLRARAEVAARGGPGHEVRAEDLGVEARLDRGLPPAGSPPPSGRSGLPLHEAILRLEAPGRSLSIVTSSDAPAGSGLGGSSALAVSLLAAIRRGEGRPLDATSLAETARDVEAQVLRVPTGVQDHLAAIHGGVSAIRFGPGRAVRERLDVDPAGLESRGVLAYLGASRASSRANWDMLRRALDGDPATNASLAAIAAIAGRMEEALRRGDLDEAARLLGAEWEERRRLSPAVSTPETEAALAAARRAGAAGGKICGAGGGGCLFVMGPPEARGGVAQALQASGCRVLDFRVDLEGLRVDEG